VVQMRGGTLLNVSVCEGGEEWARHQRAREWPRRGMRRNARSLMVSSGEESLEQQEGEISFSAEAKCAPRGRHNSRTTLTAYASQYTNPHTRKSRSTAETDGGEKKRREDQGVIRSIGKSWGATIRESLGPCKKKTSRQIAIFSR